MAFNLTRRAALQLVTGAALGSALPAWSKPKRKLVPAAHTGLAPQDDAFLALPHARRNLEARANHA